MAPQPDYSGSAMLALYPPPDLAKALALDGGLDPAGMHVTLVYVGDAAHVDPQALNAAAKALADRWPLAAQISGSARFTGADRDVLVALVDSPDLEDLRRDAVARCAEHGITVPREHGYTAHLTRAYIDPADPAALERTEPLTAAFTAISAVHGQDRTDHPFTGAGHAALREAARHAYAAGWARSGGPMTERVKAGCAAAIDLACQHRHDPAILEATLKLGSLEGAWAKVYQRRDQVIADAVAAVTAEWKRVLTRDMLAAAVSDFRRRAGLSEASGSDSGQDDAVRQAQIAADANDAATAMLQALPGSPEWGAVRTALRDALAAGRAEGTVGAVAIAAERAEKIGLDWNIAFDDAYRALADLATLWADADGWLGRMLDQATADLGRTLAGAAADGATYAQMLSGAMAALDAQDVQAVSFVVDWATATALGRGALDLYRSEGLNAVDWLSAGDGRVCPTCADNEDNSPYTPDAFPLLPAHPRCRCTPAAAAFDLANYADWFAAA